MSFFKKLFLLVIVGLLGWSLQAQAFLIEPVRYTVVVDPGEEQTLKVSVRNTEKTDQQFSMHIKSATQDDTGHTLPLETPSIAQAWVTMNTSTFTLKAGKARDILFTVAVPAATQPGTHLLMLVAETQGLSGRAAISAQAGVLVSLTVGGMVNETVTIKQWSPSAVYAQDTERIFDLTLENLGTVETPLVGTLVLSDRKGTTLSETPVRLGNRLQPGSSRRLSVPVSLSAGHPIAGWYHAKLVVHFGTQNQTIAASQTLYYGPWWIAGITIFLLLIIIIVLARLLRRKKAV